jgi:hypothetical protein
VPTSYQPSPTPGDSFPALKTPPPMVEPERPAGGLVVGMSLVEGVEDASLENGEEMLALGARLSRLTRRLAALGR